MRRGIVLGLLLAGLCGADAASAATVKVADYGTRYFQEGVVYRAGPDEANALKVRMRGSSEIVLTDPGARIRPGRRCRRITPHSAICRLKFAVVLKVFTRDRDDRVDAAVPRDMVGTAWIWAGAGSDKVTGSDNPDRLYGQGGGRDVLRGGSGGDRISDGDSDAQAGADVLDGGAGADRVDYAGRTQGVAIDLAAGVGGATGEDDQITGFERAIGGAGPDELTGTAAKNRLNGGAGDDTVRAGDGRDVVDAGPGADDVDAGAGDDLVAVKSEPPGDRIDCGDGYDDLSYSLPEDLVANCEDIQPGIIGWLFDSNVSVERDAVTFMALCVPSTPCRGKITLLADGQEIATDVDIEVPQDPEYPIETKGPVRVPVSEEAAAQLSGARLTARISSTDGSSGGFSVELPIPRR